MNEPEDDAASRRACAMFLLRQDIQPLIELLSSGRGNAEAQRCAADLLLRATKQKLPDKPKHELLPVHIIVSYLAFLDMGLGSEEAKKHTAKSVGRSVKAVEKIIYGHPDLVAKVRADLSIPTG